MKVFKHILGLGVILMMVFLTSPAQQSEQSPPPPKYRMELIYIFEPRSTEFIFAIGNAGFKSVASLKNFVGNLPAGSTLEWAPGCKRTGGEPLLSSEEEMQDFKAFCLEKNINFVLIPSG